MKLKENIDVIAFLQTAKECSGDVFFHSGEGDILNLKSLLSQYVLMSVLCNPALLTNAHVVCILEEDYAKLSDFLTP